LRWFEVVSCEKLMVILVRTSEGSEYECDWDLNGNNIISTKRSIDDLTYLGIWFTRQPIVHVNDGRSFIWVFSFRVFYSDEFRFDCCIVIGYWWCKGSVDARSNCEKQVIDICEIAEDNVWFSAVL